MNSKKLLFCQRLEQNQEDLSKDVVVPFMKKTKALSMIMKLRGAYQEALFVYWKRMVLFICNKSKCTCSRCLSKCYVSWSSSEKQNDTINININEDSGSQIIPDNVKNLETGKPELDKQEMRAAIV